jgi:hypothetical protein
MRIHKAMISMGLGAVVLTASGPAAAAIYIKYPDIDGGVSVEGFRWEAKGATVAVRQAAKPRYKAENGQLVRVDDPGEGGEVQRIASPVRKPERDPGAVLTRPLSSGPGMLVVRTGWSGCREGANYPSAQVGEGGGPSVTLLRVSVVACSGETMALNYEEIK